MNENVAGLAPPQVWTWFERLNEIPRPSKKEDQVIEFVVGIGKQLGLETIVDDIRNVIIRKPATAGKESCTPVVLQAHLDMVHQKNSDTDFDFATQGIQSFIDGDWVKAKGTTLGADNGMGVASILAVLASDDLQHGPLEALFTIDEETGMTGALQLKPGLLQGKILLNTDTEDEGELTIGCAGGLDSTISVDGSAAAASTGSAVRVSVTGLCGGHSGCEIHLGRGNANLIMNRILQHCGGKPDCGFEIANVAGGNLRNAIPRECFALLNVTGDASALIDTVSEIAAVIGKEIQEADPGLSVTAEAVSDSIDQVLPPETAVALMKAIAAAPAGVIRMSEGIPDLVETSTNLSKVSIQPDQIKIDFLSRSSVNSARDQVSQDIEAAFAPLQATATHSGEYPGWEPKPDSEILVLMKQVYQELFDKPPIVNAVHAGLECGIIGSHYPEMEMVSLGPTIKNPHSPDEKCHIPSVASYWTFLTEVLCQIT